jgi:hypothetical protein
MTPYLQLRLWWQRASSGDRLAATLALVVVVALAAWALVPTTSGHHSTSVRTAAGSAETAGAAGPVGSAGAETASPAVAGGVAGTTGAGSTAPQASASAAGGTTPRTGGQSASGATSGGAGSGQSAATTGACLPTPKGAVGVTDKTVLLDFAVLDLAGPIGNSAANQASADDLVKMGQALIADVNARGGLACRTATGKFYRVNPIGPDQGRNACLQIIQDKPGLAIDAGGFAFPQSAYACIPQQKIPLISASWILTSEAMKFAPYLGSPVGDLGTVMRDTALGLRDLGWFDPAKGFKKLGLLDDECAPEVDKQLDDALAKAGIAGAKVSKYSFACPSGGFASPADMAQAVSQHRAAGVTHVIPLTGGGSFKAYAAAANSQGFHPHYAFTDYQGAVITAGTAAGPDANSIDGTLDMSTGKFGMETTPGFPIDAPTKRCQAVAVKAGLPATIAFHGGGGLCSLMWTAEAAFTHAQALTPNGILPGLFRAGPVSMAWPEADATFKAPSKFYGADTWWPIQFHKECACWHVLDPKRRPSYQ